MSALAYAVPNETLAGPSGAILSIADTLSRRAALVLSTVTVKAKDFAIKQAVVGTIAAVMELEKAPPAASLTPVCGADQCGLAHVVGKLSAADHR